MKYMFTHIHVYNILTLESAIFFYHRKQVKKRVKEIPQVNISMYRKEFFQETKQLSQKKSII